MRRRVSSQIWPKDVSRVTEILTRIHRGIPHTPSIPLDLRTHTYLINLSIAYNKQKSRSHGLRRRTHHKTPPTRKTHTHSTSRSPPTINIKTHLVNKHTLPAPPNHNQRYRNLLHQTHPQRSARHIPHPLTITLPHPHPHPRLRRGKKSRRKTHIPEIRSENHSPWCELL